MARFLFTVWPFQGHLHPCLDIACGLRDAGHEVGVFSGSTGRAEIEGEGLRFFPFVELDECAVLAHLLNPARRFTGRRPLSLMRFLAPWLVGTIPFQVADLRWIVDAWRPDAIVCDVTMWGPILVTMQRHGIRVAVLSMAAGCTLPGPQAPVWALGLGPPTGWVSRARTSLIGRALDVVARDLRHGASEARRSFGLAPLASSVIEFVSQYTLYLVRSAPEFDYNRTDLPPTVHYVGALVDNPPPCPQAPWIGELRGRGPVIHITEGTMQARPTILSAAVRGLADLRGRVVMTTGPHRRPSELNLGPVPRHMQVEQYVPHRHLFPHVDAVVTQGGAGTVLTALRHGVPLLVIPAESDQPGNAHCVVTCGAGLRMARWACTPRRLRAAVERLLDDARFRERARAMGSILANYGGASRAVGLLEEYAAGRMRLHHGRTQPAAMTIRES